MHSDKPQHKKWFIISQCIGNDIKFLNSNTIIELTL